MTPWRSCGGRRGAIHGIHGASHAGNALAHRVEAHGAAWRRSSRMSVLLWASGRGASVQDRLCRTLAIAEALGARGVGTRIALPAEHATLGWLEVAGMRNPVLLGDREPELPQVLAARGGADALVVDVERPLSRAEMRALSGGRPVAVVEGRGPGLAEADLIVVLERDARRPQALHGLAYVPLRRAVRLARDLRGRPHPAPIVVVRLGG